jgi:hypothetical protein
MVIKIERDVYIMKFNKFLFKMKSINPIKIINEYIIVIVKNKIFHLLREIRRIFCIFFINLKHQLLRLLFNVNLDG